MSDLLSDPTSASFSLAEIGRLSPAALAYLGDAIYELHVRRQQLFPPTRPELYHRQVVRRVRGSAQARLLLALLPYLSPEEREIVRWGRNGCGRPPRHLPLADYQNASGLETILGYLYLTDPERLRHILALTDVLAKTIGEGEG
ncbi:ribonuclease III family protein [Thermostichus sp. MS-CIW-21]|uniref:ribonuclease III domain-containing protein n=1 Tax=unclassified Synechococcus TaxID=2626047 RepID=UPI0000693FC0|nr:MULTISPECIES: ribonuclease III domain-containing protein [unclassified Synechococcus]ABC98513.1 RNase3 domain protein [Synechococcus sp. JA-3-3Ab]PIK86007.1 RNAase [Synechococcus sp. 63AY4M2]PIK89269.1 RNAase [Synechococcus sp. 65AY6A5]PIK91355.1 RNAase [Synechococcus sp. 65AY6Li]PIK95069.1 RNAase [Synechococcus sp. 60AY4M2]